MVDYHIHSDFRESIVQQDILDSNAKVRDNGPMVEALCSRWGFEPITHYIMVGNDVVWIGSFTACKNVVDKIENGHQLPSYMQNFM